MTKPDIRRKAIELLARREHTRDELRLKLERRGFSRDSIDRLLQVLIKEKLLSSTRYIEDYIASRIRRFYGPNRIRMDLESKGLDKEEIARAVFAADVDWLENARRCYAKKYRTIASQDIKECMKRKQYLHRQGYPWEIIREIIE